MSACGEADLQLHTFVTFVPIGGVWWASRPGCFSPRELTPVPTGAWVGSRVGIDVVGEL